MVFTTHNRIAPTKPSSLREAVHRVAALGGFLGRNADAEPGTQSLWLGLQCLDDIAATGQVMRDGTQTSVSRATFSSSLPPLDLILSHLVEGGTTERQST